MPYVLPKVAAEMLAVTPSTVIRHADAGRLDFVRTPGGHRRILLESVERLAAELSPRA